MFKIPAASSTNQGHNKGWIALNTKHEVSSKAKQKETNCTPARTERHEKMETSGMPLNNETGLKKKQVAMG